MVFSWLVGFFRTRTVDFANQLQSFQEELKAQQSKKQHYNSRVHTFPKSVTKFILIMCIVMSIVSLVFVGFSREKRSTLYTTLGSVVAIHIIMLIMTRRAVGYYYRNNIYHTETSIERLLVKHREALDKLKKKSDYYTTHLLVQKYEASIAHMENQLLGQPTKELDLNNIRSPQTAKPSQKKTFASVGTQTDIKMNFDDSLLDNANTIKRTYSEMGSPSTLRPIEARPRSKSYNRDALPAITYSADSDSATDDDSPATPVRKHSSTSSLGADFAIQEQQKRMHMMYIKLKSEIANMDRRRQELDSREQAIERKRNELIASSTTVSRSKLYDQAFTSRYKKEDVMVKNVNSSWVDRIVDKIMGQSPQDCLALICDKCHSHNGLLMLEDGDQVQRFRCWACGFFNNQLLIKNVGEESATPRNVEQKQEEPSPSVPEAIATRESTGASPVSDDSIEYDELVNSDDVTSSDDEHITAAKEEYEALQQTDLLAND